MAFKILRWAFGKEDEKEEVRQLQVARRTQRIGMDKNFRVGQVIYISKKRDNQTHILVNIIEMCNTDDGDIEPCRYNLWVHIPSKWINSITSDLIGQFVAIGFYIQSFRNKDITDSYNTVLSCRFINRIESEQVARSLAIDLMDSRLFVDHPYLKLSNIKLNKQ